MPATAATIQIAIEAQTATLKKGFADAKKSVDGLGASLSGKVALGMAKFHAAVLVVKGALLSMRGVFNSILTAFDAIDKVEKFAARIGTTGDQLRVLQFAAEQTGVSADTMNMALQRMTRRVAEAAKGTGEARDALKELGLSAEYLTRLRPDQSFALIADAMENVTNQGDRVRLAMKLFDSEGVALVNTLAGGSEALENFGREAERLGITLGDHAATIAETVDAINELKLAWRGLVQELAIYVAPLFRDIALSLQEIRGLWGDIFGGVASADRKIARMRSLSLALPDRKPEIPVGLRETISPRVGTMIVELEKRLSGVVDKIVSTPNIAAATRASAAGFSALQQAQRDRADRERRLERRHAELMRAMRDIEHAIKETGADIGVVSFK